jgi:hypothetical protein
LTPHPDGGDNPAFQTPESEEGAPC